MIEIEIAYHDGYRWGAHMELLIAEVKRLQDRYEWKAHPEPHPNDRTWLSEKKA